MYTIADAKKQAADVIVAARIAWLHLTSDIAEYNKAMKNVFSKLLMSVQGTMGAYKLKQGEIVWRPAP